METLAAESLRDSAAINPRISTPQPSMVTGPAPGASPCETMFALLLTTTPGSLNVDERMEMAPPI